MRGETVFRVGGKDFYDRSAFVRVALTYNTPPNPMFLHHIWRAIASGAMSSSGSGRVNSGPSRVRRTVRSGSDAEASGQGGNPEGEWRAGRRRG